MSEKSSSDLMAIARATSCFYECMTDITAEIKADNEDTREIKQKIQSQLHILTKGMKFTTDLIPTGNLMCEILIIISDLFVDYINKHACMTKEKYAILKKKINTTLRLIHSSFKCDLKVFERSITTYLEDVYYESHEIVSTSRDGGQTSSSTSN